MQVETMKRHLIGLEELCNGEEDVSSFRGGEFFPLSYQIKQLGKQVTALLRVQRRFVEQNLFLQDQALVKSLKRDVFV